jgi:hypothetical protein
MKLTQEIIKLLSIPELFSGFSFIDQDYVIRASDCEFVAIAKNSLLLNGHNLLDKIYSPDEKSESYLLDYQPFFQKISDSIMNLDHIGISYSCLDIAKEINFYKDILEDSPFELKEEINPDGDSRWFFARSKEDEDAPLFEIVLRESKEEVVSVWVPHFQIDLNTALPIEELRKLTNEYLASDFIKWEMDIQGKGVVLAMGFLGQVGKTKICLGLGTNIRTTDIGDNKYLILRKKL